MNCRIIILLAILLCLFSRLSVQKWGRKDHASGCLGECREQTILWPVTAEIWTSGTQGDWEAAEAPLR